MLGITTFVLPTVYILATLLNLAIDPSFAKDGIIEFKTSSSFPLLNLYPSSLLLVTSTMRSKSFVLIPVGKILRMLVDERYYLPNALRLLILLVKL